MWLYQQPPNYLSAAKMVVNGKITVPGGATYSEELTNFYGTQIELMQSDEVRHRAAQRVATTVAGAVARPGRLSAQRTPESSIFMLTGHGREPAYTQKFLEAVLTEYTAVKKQMRADLSDDKLGSITVELQRLDAEINQGEAELIEFQKDNNVGFLQEQGNSAAEYLVTLNRSLANLKNEYQLLQTVELDSTLDRGPEAPRHDAGAERSRRRHRYAEQDGDRHGRRSQKRDRAGHPSQLPRRMWPSVQARARFPHRAAPRTRENLSPRPSRHGGSERRRSPTKSASSTRMGSQGVDDLAIRRDALKLEIENLEKTIKEWEVKAVDVGKRMADYNRIKEKVDRAREVNQQQVGQLAEYRREQERRPGHGLDPGARFRGVAGSAALLARHVSGGYRRAPRGLVGHLPPDAIG